MSKENSKFLVNNVGKAGIGYVNLNKQLSDLMFVIPIYKSNLDNSLNISLNYSLKNIEKINDFGKGILLSYYRKLTKNENKILVEKSDFTTDVYTLDEQNNNKYNCSTNDDFIIESEDGTFKLYENSGCYCKFAGNQTFMTELRKTINDEILQYVTYTNNLLSKIDNGKNEVAEFSYNNSRIDEINIYRYNESNQKNLIFKVKFTYDSFGFLNKITYVNIYDSSKSHNTIYELNPSDLKVSLCDESVNYSMSYELNELNEVVKVKENYSSSNIEGKQFLISYDSNNETTITDYNGHKTKKYFDSQNRLCFEIDENGVTKYYKYDTNGKMVYESNAQNNNKDYAANNLIRNGYFEDDNIEWQLYSGEVEALIETSNSNYYNNILGDRVLKIKNRSVEENCVSVRQEIIVSGTEYDQLSFNIWGAQKHINSTIYDNVIANVKIYMFNDNHLFQTETESFELKDSNEIWEYKNIGIKPKMEYTSLVVELNVYGPLNEFYFDGISMYKKSFGHLYEYDDSQIVATNNDGNNLELEYNEDKMIKSFKGGTLGGKYHKYDTNGNLIEQTGHYNNKTLMSYNGKNKITSRKILSGDGSKYIQNTYNYNTSNNTKIDKEFLISKINSMGHEIFYEWDKVFNLLNSIENELGEKITYSYDSWKNITKIKLEDADENEQFVEYEYYEQSNKLKSIVTSSGNVYSFEYDLQWQLTSISLTKNGVKKKIKEYEYYFKDGINTGLIKSQTFGDKGDKYSFDYNNYGKVIKIIYYQVNSNQGIDLCTYDYDNIGRPVKYHHLVDDEYIIDILYNDNNGVEKIINSKGFSIEYKYDNLGKINCKNISFDDKNICQTFEQKYRSEGVNPEYVYEKVKYISENTNVQNHEVVYSCFFNDENNNSLTFESGKNRTVSSLLPVYGTTLVPENDNLIKCIDYENTNVRLGYNMNFYSLPESAGTIMFWFKPKDTDFNKYLLSVGSDKTKNFIGLKINNSNKLELELYDLNREKCEINMCSNGQVNYNEWNFVALSWLNRCDGANYPDICRYTMYLNNEIVFGEKNDPRYYVNISYPTCLVNIGCVRNSNEVEESSKFDGKVSALIMSKGYEWSTALINTYYFLLKEYIFENIYKIDENNNYVNASSTNLYNYDSLQEDGLDVIDFNNTVISKNNVEPILISNRKNLRNDTDKMFNYNNKIKRYALVLDGQDLKYNFELANSGTISAKGYFIGFNDYQYLFDNEDANGRYLSLFRNKERKICVSVNGEVINTNIIVDDKKWTFISLSWEKLIVGTSLGTSNAYNIKVFVDEQSYETQVITDFAYLDLVTQLGKCVKSRELITMDYTNDPMLGQLEMLVYTDVYASNDLIDSIKEVMKISTLSRGYDELGLIKEKSLVINDRTKFKQRYSYKSVNGSSSQISTKVGSEYLLFDNRNINFEYEYDVNGNITHIHKDGELFRKYEYDFRNYLVKEYLYDSQTYYVMNYDNNGNMVRKFKYDFTNELLDFEVFDYENETWKDLITSKRNSVGSTIYNYSSQFGYLTQIEENGNIYDFGWKGNCLINYTDNMFKNVSMCYDEKGLRIRKDIYNLDFYDYCQYFYDSNKLIREIEYRDGIGELYYKNFLYDENNNLYAINYNDQTYYYVKDIKGEICGLIDENGVMVVEYYYDAWGNVISVNDYSNINLSIINPFRYKDYYYDKDLQMYYLNGRYYNPKLHRFISLDSIINLGSTGIGLNLFSYCGNNPVNRIDINGCSWSSFWSNVGDGISDIWDDVKDAAEDACNWVAETATDVWDWTKTTAKNAWDWTKETATDVWDWTKEKATDVWDWTKETATSAWNWVTNTAIPAVGSFFKDTVWNKWIVGGVWNTFCVDWVWNTFCVDWVWNTFCCNWLVAAFDFMKNNKVFQLVASIIGAIISLVGFIASCCTLNPFTASAFLKWLMALIGLIASIIGIIGAS